LATLPHRRCAKDASPRPHAARVPRALPHAARVRRLGIRRRRSAGGPGSGSPRGRRFVLRRHHAPPARRRHGDPRQVHRIPGRHVAGAGRHGARSLRPGVGRAGRARRGGSPPSRPAVPIRGAAAGRRIHCHLPLPADTTRVVQFALPHRKVQNRRWRSSSRSRQPDASLGLCQCLWVPAVAPFVQVGLFDWGIRQRRSDVPRPGRQALPMPARVLLRPNFAPQPPLADPGLCHAPGDGFSGATCGILNSHVVLASPKILEHTVERRFRHVVPPGPTRGRHHLRRVPGRGGEHRAHGPLSWQASTSGDGCFVATAAGPAARTRPGKLRGKTGHGIVLAISDPAPHAYTGLDLPVRNHGHGSDRSTTAAHRHRGLLHPERCRRKLRSFVAVAGHGLPHGLLPLRACLHRRVQPADRRHHGPLRFRAGLPPHACRTGGPRRRVPLAPRRDRSARRRAGPVPGAVGAVPPPRARHHGWVRDGAWDRGKLDHGAARTLERPEGRGGARDDGERVSIVLDGTIASALSFRRNSFVCFPFWSA
ncbi:hypothetical protein DFJ74DRAFT_133769, partial [Hyaloraphidium curvatum]